MINQELGLRQRIARAASDEEIENLLKEAEGFKYASSRSRSAWFHTAARRRVELKRNAEGQGNKIQTRQSVGN